VNALAQVEVGQYLNRHFASAFQKVATFEINGRQKQGGNVAAYFCTPQGRVLHAIAGPVDGATLLREARWVNETFQLAQLHEDGPAQLQAVFRKAHVERLRVEHNVSLPEAQLPRFDSANARTLEQLLAHNGHLGLNEPGQVHLLLTVAATPRLEQIYQVVFERVLNEKISTRPVAGE
jgi:hypothetical protein